jgi:hypothetical protein
VTPIEKPARAGFAAPSRTRISQRRSRLAVAEGRAANVGAAARIATRMFVENRRRCAGGSPPWERRIVEM